LPPSIATRSPNQSSRSKGVGQPCDLELLTDDGSIAGSGAAQLNIDLLHHHVGRTLVLLDEVAEFRLGRLQFGCERLADRGLLAHQLDVVLQPSLLDVVQRLVVLAERVVVLLRRGVGAERPAVAPRACRVERHDLGCRRRKQFTVVADEHDGLARLVELLFEPALGRDVEEVVGLVEHQDLELAAQERLQREALLFATAQRAQWSVGDLIERFAERPRRAFVPQHFRVVAADVAPRSDCIGIRHRVVVEQGGRTVEPCRSVADTSGGDR
jgi:hypothetical protein